MRSWIKGSAFKVYVQCICSCTDIVGLSYAMYKVWLYLAVAISTDKRLTALLPNSRNTPTLAILCSSASKLETNKFTEAERRIQGRMRLVVLPQHWCCIFWQSKEGTLHSCVKAH